MTRPTSASKPCPTCRNKYFYVWPRCTDRLHRRRPPNSGLWHGGENPDDWWRSEDTEIVHVIGKVHRAVPCVVLAGGVVEREFPQSPKTLHVHGMLRVNGEKDVEVAGHVHQCPHFRRAHWIRSICVITTRPKLGAKIEDIDLSFDDFNNRVNAELVNKIVNSLRACRAVRASAFRGARLSARPESEDAGDQQ